MRLLLKLVAAHGFEPRTLRVWTACSSQLSYAAKLELMTRIELVTLSLPRIRSADWATSAYEIGCGGRTWTSDLRVMSPTSYQLLHPAISVVVRVGLEPTKRNAADLQSAPFSHSGTSPLRQEILYCIVCALSTLFCQLFSQLVKLKRRRFCGDIFNGAGERNRTPNLLITSQLLCLLSYASVITWSIIT